jgi:hypothetical protein
MPANWRPLSRTVVEDPVPAGEGVFPLRLRSHPERQAKPRQWLEDLDARVLNLPRFMR